MTDVKVETEQIGDRSHTTRVFMPRAMDAPAGRRDVSVAFLHPGQVAGDFNASIIQMVMWDADHDRRIGAVSSVQSGPRVAAARNNVVRDFLNTEDRPWLFFVDSDMTFAPNALDALLDVADPEQAPIVSGVAFSIDRDERILPAFWIGIPDENGDTAVVLPDEWPDDAVLKVVATGAACTLIHRSVLEKMAETYADQAQPFYAEREIGQHVIGEDVVFCLRAAECEFSVHVVPWVVFGHVKARVYGTDEYARYRAHLSAFGEEDFIEARRSSRGLRAVSVPEAAAG